MNQRVSELIEHVVSNCVDVVNRGSASAVCLKIEGNKGFPVFVEIESVQVPVKEFAYVIHGDVNRNFEEAASLCGAAAVPALRVSTNDFDGMAVSAPQLYIVDFNSQRIVQGILAFLGKELEDYDSVEIMMVPTPAPNQPFLPTFVGDSESGPDRIHVPVPWSPPE